MSKKQKIDHCLQCGHKVFFNDKTICSHPKTNGHKIGDSLEIKVNKIIPDWCPLEDWNND